MSGKVAVVGAGIVGVTMAYELAALGHAVTVFERRGSVAAEASFAHTGVIGAGQLTPWAAPGRPAALLRRLCGRDAPLRFGGARAWGELPWIWRWWRAGRPAVHAANRGAMLRLAQFSRERLLELTRALHLEYDQMPGCLVLLRDERDLALARPGLALLDEHGIAHTVLDAARGRALEPGLHPDTPLHAAIHLPQDGVGNCRQFAQLLRAEAQRLGVRFRFDTEVRRLIAGATPALATGDGAEQRFDAVVVCAGAQANAVLRSIGVKLPLAPVHGCSVTAPLRHHDGQPRPGPRAALIDPRHRVTISRLGERIRIAGGAELGGRLDRLDPAVLQTLYRVLDDWFPGAALTREAVHWKGARPMLPDGPPVLGESGAPGIWLNLGHGSSGWALACGSARALAERISGRESPLDLSRLTVGRLG